ncbi:MAG: helix-turn-helix domain-containing protein [Clostridiales bacterium]|nr:helix-turn-helix domain-containing protein [Clostridiales bacterium]
MADTNMNAPFLSISDTCKVTGLSQYAIRKGCVEGTIPHIKSGRTYLIDVSALLEQLHEKARSNAAR